MVAPYLKMNGSQWRHMTSKNSFVELSNNNCYQLELNCRSF